MKIVSIKLSNGEYYVIGTDWVRIEKMYDDKGKLWYAVSGNGDYNDVVNGDWVTIIRYAK